MKAKEKAHRKLKQKADHMQQQVDRLQIGQTLYTKAQELSAANEKAYREKIEKEKDGQYYLTMLKKGTQSDKISSLSIIIQRNPQASLSYLMQLLTLTKKPNRKAAESAIFALKDLFVQN
jgi:hypothetical protein